MAQATYATSGIGALIKGASIDQFASPIRAVHAQIAQILAGSLSLISVEFGDRVGQSNKLLNVAAIADDTGRAI